MYVDFLMKNYDLIIMLVVIGLLVGLLKKKAGYITSAILGFIMIFRICGVVPDFTTIIKTIGPAIINLFSNAVKLFYDLFMMVGSQ